MRITGLFMHNHAVWMPLSRVFSVCRALRRGAWFRGADAGVHGNATGRARPRFARFLAATRARLLWLDHKIGDRCIADVKPFVPGDPLAEEIASSFQGHLPGARFTGNPHRATR